MDPRTPATAGSKRPPELDPEDFPRKRPKGSDDKLHQLVGMLKDRALAQTPVIGRMLMAASNCQGNTFDQWTPDEVKTVLNALIRIKEFAVFAELYNLYQEARDQTPYIESWAGTSESRYGLDIQLPSNWALEPAEVDDMLAAFNTIHVETLTIRAGPLDVNQPSAVPAALCKVIAQCLQNGLRHLVLNGALADAESVTTALTGHHLKSVALDFSNETLMSTRDVVSLDEMSSHDKLCKALLHCSSLTDLTLHHTIRGVKAFAQGLNFPDSPRLTSLSLTVKGLRAQNEGEYDFTGDGDEFLTLATQTMVALASNQQLSMLSVDLRVSHPGMLNRVFFTPWKDNAHLVQLRILGGSCGHESVNLMPNALSLAASCPKMKHFSWKGLEVLGGKRLNLWQLIEAMKAAGGSAVASLGVGSIKPSLSELRSRLETFELNGGLIPSRDLAEFFEGIVTFETSFSFDLEYSKTDMKEALRILIALARNPLIEGAKLSPNTEDYFWPRTDGRIMAFQNGILSNINEHTVLQVLELIEDGNDEDDEVEKRIRKSAVSDFKEHQAMANRLYVDIDRQLKENKKTVVLHVLTLGTAGVVKAIPGVSDIADVIAPRVMAHLKNEYSTVSGVWLSGVNRAATAGRRMGEKSRAMKLLRAQVEKDREPRRALEIQRAREASLRDMPKQRQAELLADAIAAIGMRSMPSLQAALDMGLDVNTLDAQGANVLLMAAVDDDSAASVKLLKAAGADDKFGHAAAAALHKSKAVRDALEEVG